MLDKSEAILNQEISDLKQRLKTARTAARQYEVEVQSQLELRVEERQQRIVQEADLKQRLEAAEREAKTYKDFLAAAVEGGKRLEAKIERLGKLGDALAALRAVPKWFLGVEDAYDCRICNKVCMSKEAFWHDKDCPASRLGERAKIPRFLTINY